LGRTLLYPRGMSMTNLLSLFEQSKKFKADEIIIHEGEENRDLYILSNGVLEVSVKSEDKMIVVSEITPPEILGEISFLNGSPRTATVSAKTDVEMYILGYETVQKEMSEIPTWFRMVLLAFTSRMKSCDAKIKEYDQKIKDLETKISRLRES
jgi:CRP-like cAMP-binding protein